MWTTRSTLWLIVLGADREMNWDDRIREIKIPTEISGPEIARSAEATYEAEMRDQGTQTPAPKVNVRSALLDPPILGNTTQLASALELHGSM